MMVAHFGDAGCFSGLFGSCVVFVVAIPGRWPGIWYGMNVMLSLDVRCEVSGLGACSTTPCVLRVACVYVIMAREIILVIALP